MLHLRMRYQLLLRLLIGLALWLAGEQATAQVTFRIVLEPDGLTYSVYLRSTTAYAGTSALISTSQMTLVVPHGTGADRFVVTNLTSPIPGMRWQQNDRVDAPAENPDVDYLFFGFINNNSPVVLFPIPAGQDVLLFQFKRQGNCLGAAQIMRNGTDPFRTPNSRGVNAGNSLSVLAARGDVYKDDPTPTPTISLSLSSGTVCAGQSLLLTAAVAAGSGPYTYQWFIDDQPIPGAGSASTLTYRIPEQAGATSYTFRVSATEVGKDACQTPRLLARKPITVRPRPTVEVQLLGTTCVALPTTLIAKPVPNATYQWFRDGVAVAGGGQFLQISESGGYAVRATVNGCSATSPVVPVVGVKETERVSVQLAPVPTIVGGTPVQLNPVVSNAVSFSWTPADGLSNAATQNPIARPSQTTTYTLVARSAQGCPGTDTVTVRVVPPLYMPDAFSPNADGLNDTWVIENAQLHQPCRVQIFDRWGSLVFLSDHYQNDWKADESGRPLEAGLYIYVVQTPLLSYKGQVMLLR